MSHLTLIPAALVLAGQSVDVQDALDYTTTAIYGESCCYSLSIDRWGCELIGNAATGAGLSPLQLAILSHLPQELTMAEDLNSFRDLAGAVATLSGSDPGATWTHELQTRTVSEYGGEALIEEASGGGNSQDLYYIRTLDEDTLVGGGTSDTLRVYGAGQAVYLGSLAIDILAPFPGRADVGGTWLSREQWQVQEGGLGGLAAVQLSKEMREGAAVIGVRSFIFQRISGYMLPRASHHHGGGETSISVYLYGLADIPSRGLVPFPSEVVTISIDGEELFFRRMRLGFLGEATGIDDLRIPVRAGTKIRCQSGALSHEERLQTRTLDHTLWPERIRRAILAL